MRTSLWPLLCIFSLPLLAATQVTPTQQNDLGDRGKIIINSLWEEVGYTASLPLPDDSPPAVPTPIPTIPTPVPTPVAKATSKPLSKGQLYVQEQLKKNREILRKKREQNQAKTRIESKNEEFDDSSMKGKYLNKLAKLKKKRNQGLMTWRNKIENTYEQWEKARKEFRENLSSYKENTFNFEAPSVHIRPKELKKSLATAVKEDFHVLPYSLDVDVRDQGKRPTCAAFAGVRAIEVLLAGSNQGMDLSEQYFYFSSKPECQSYPCKNRGSWVRKGFDKSKRSRQHDIPLESSCPYINMSITGNETQIPLLQPCQQGVVKVSSYSELQTIDDLYIALTNNKPVIAGFKLSPNFYENEGLITYKDSIKAGKMDAHAGGHALLLVGYMKLPKKHQSEGKVCFITANSWGEGWGKGGHACLSEKWIKHYRVKNAFIGLNSVSLK